MGKYNLQSEVDGKEVTIGFELKFLSNQLRSQIYNLDADYQKKFNAEFKDSKVAKLQKELSDKIKEVEATSTNMSTEQKNAIVNQLYLKFVTDLADEKMIDENKDYTVKTWDFSDGKTIDTLKLIVNRSSMSDNDLRFINLPLKSDFWENCDIQKVGEIVNSFRTKYKIAG